MMCAAALVAAFLGGCDTPVPSRSFPDISFTHKIPYNLDVASIEVETRPAPAPDKGTVVHELPVSLTAVAEKWARQRLKPVGASGVAVVTIEKASVVEQRLKKTGGVRGAFTTDQTERYIGELQLSISIAENRGQALARAGSTRTRTIAEDATLAEREKLWFDMVEKLTRGMDAEMDKQIPQHLAIYLR
jgi:hypothetical protein